MSGQPGTAVTPEAEYRVRAKVWLYSGAGGWHFVNLSPRQSYEVKVRFGHDGAGWGAVPVHVKVRRTEWDTSLFWDSKSETYLFAIKAAVRRAESIEAGDTITAQVQVVRPVRKRVRPK